MEIKNNKDQFDSRLAILKDHFAAVKDDVKFKWGKINAILMLKIKKNWTTESSNSNYQINSESVKDFFPVIHITDAFPHWRLSMPAYISKNVLTNFATPPSNDSWFDAHVSYRHKIQNGYPYLQLTLEDQLRLLKNNLKEGDQIFFLKEQDTSNYYVFATKDSLFTEDSILIIDPTKASIDKTQFELADNNLGNENPIDDKAAITDEKVIEENESIRDFAFNVFSHFYGDNWSELIEQTSSKPASINSTDYVSHDLDVFTRLIGEFQSPQTKEAITSANTQRFFEEPIYRNKDKFYFFTNQWTGTTGDLSFESLKSYFETNYPEYKFEKTEKVFKLLKRGEAQGIPFNYKSFHAKTKEAGLQFTEKIISRFVASLCTKPFVICSGLSGSGKTKLAQSFVKWICKSEEQYKIVPVGADWTNREPLLGFPNGLDPDKYVFPDSGVLQLIINAGKSENKNKPYFLILDEMNLSHVERYFADFLSIMESQDTIKLYSGTDRLGPENLKIDTEVSWPKNLFIIGTVNIDETTYMFSPKVLDRANVIEFRISESEITNYLAEPGNLDMSRFINSASKQGYGTAMAKDFLDKTKENVISTIPTQNTLVLFFNELRKCGAEFGYRSASEINRLIAVLDSLTKDNMKWDEKDFSADDFIDIAIMQKLLPKLHGSRNKLTKILPVLGALCLEDKEKIKENYFEKIDAINYLEDGNIKYKLSFEKICRMYKNAIENGYASYAEA